MARPKSGLTTAQIVAKSEEKRGVKSKSFKLTLEDIHKIEQLAKTHQIPQNQLLMQAIELFEKAHST